MNANATIIDVRPLEYSSMRTRVQDSQTASAAQGAPSEYRYHEPSWRNPSTWQDSPQDSTQTHFGGASTFDQARVGHERTSKSPFSAIGGLAEVVIGAGLVAIGLPLLVLPGPGFITTAVGTLLIAHGVSELKR